MNFNNFLRRIKNKKFIFGFVILYLLYKALSYIIMDCLYDTYDPDWDFDFDVIDLTEDEIIDIAIDLIESGETCVG